MNPTNPQPKPFIAWENPRRCAPQGERREIPTAKPDPQIERTTDEPETDYSLPPRYNIYLYVPQPSADFVRMFRRGLWFGIGLFVLFVVSLSLDHC